MFAKKSLIQFLAGAGCFSIIQTIVLITLGAVLVNNIHYHQLLGSTIKHTGGGLIFTGLLYMLTAVLGIYSASTQNKFLLLLQFLVLALVIFLQILFGSLAVGQAVPVFDFNTQLTCLTVGGYENLPFASQQQCETFFQTDDFAGMILVWQSYYTLSTTEGSYRTMVLNFQKENFCCGNGLPVHCVNDTRGFPSSHPSTAISKQTHQRRKCARRFPYYVSTIECNADNVGKCDYDLPKGTCGLNPVTSTTRGCGAFVFKKLSTQVEVIGIIALVLLIFPILFLLASICLCFKRRDEDALPHVEFVSKVKVHAEG